MARLNEPAAESLDSLKRRFVRQNRELARSNSVQSVKIRSLETQISQLVAENISLRGNIIQLQSELDDSRNRNLTEHVDIIRRRLEEKIHEFGGLVAELSVVNKRPVKPPKPSPRSPKQSPGQKRWRTESSIGEVLIAREGWLPTIAEGKHFPRRTLEPNEITALAVNQSSDSPDIGPPPRTSVDGPKSPERQPKPNASDSAALDEEATMSSLLSANLETRRRRRETNVRRDSSIVSAIDLSPSKEINSQRPSDLWTAQPIRAGAKRKLDAANRPNENENVQAKDKNAFDLNHRLTNGKPVEGATAQISPIRKVLAPKSVNAEPAASPSKPTVQGKAHGRIAQKSGAKENVPRSTSHKERNLDTPKVSIASDIVKTVEMQPDAIKLEPKTPAPLDLFSPASTEPSESRHEGRGDTPPPSNLSSRNTVGGEGLGAGRGSRRARTAVNYAEPNLISKMRRPTKDLADAVVRDQRRSTSASIEPPDWSQGPSDQAAILKTVVIRKDDSTHDDKPPAEREERRPESPSPLGRKDEASEPASFDRTSTRDRRRSAMHQGGPSDREPQTGSSAAIGALVSGTRKTPNLASDASVTSLEVAVQQPDIYDVAVTPPSSKTLPKGLDRPENPRPSSAASVRSTGSASDKKAANKIGGSSSSALNRAKSRRQTLGSEASPAKPTQRATSSSSSSSLSASRAREVKPMKSVGALGEDAPGETKTAAQRIAERTAERTAARRKSMML